MWVQQKMTQAPAIDPRQESTNRMMLLMMPFMFGFLTLTFPSGLALYWAVSNIIGIVIQRVFTGGWGYLKFRSPSQSTPVKGK
jgi:YidC/Oxa1 family membrane protein insertase